MNIYSLLNFKKKEKLEKIENKKKGNRKTNFIFWNFEDQKKGKKRGKQKIYLGQT